jgi:aromatic ring-opening dioxygenase catalytic subunit (LigB family)
VGKEITQQIKPTAVVVFSAHWMGAEDAIRINNAEHTDLIYEYNSLILDYL